MSLIRTLRPMLADHPRIKELLKGVDVRIGRVYHSLAEVFPRLIRPAPRQLTVAITASCNFRCLGCRYGRDFMPGEYLSLDVMRQVLDDAAAAGISRVRLYGGEPLLHPDVASMIRHSTNLGMDTYITTNGVLLEGKIDELYDAGLRWLTMGFYGTGEHHAYYTQRPGQIAQLRRSLAYVRDNYGERVEMQLNFVVIKPNCSVGALQEAWEFAVEHDMFFHFDLWGYSVPFFTTGPNDEVRFAAEDRPAIDTLVEELVRLKSEDPERMPQSMTLIRSVPDWLLRGKDMQVPCDAYQLVWIGADGTVQLCDVAFKLGNVNKTRLREILFTKEHRRACRDGFVLNCPNCTCKSDSRMRKHAASLRRYGS